MVKNKPKMLICESFIYHSIHKKNTFIRRKQDSMEENTTVAKKAKTEKISISYFLLLKRFKENKHCFKIYHDEDWEAADHLFEMMTQETDEEFDIQMSGHIWELLRVLNYREGQKDFFVELIVDVRQLMDVLLFSNDDDGGIYFKGFPASETSQKLADRILKWIESQITSKSRDLRFKTKKSIKGDAIYVFTYM